jgi:ribonuclease HI
MQNTRSIEIVTPYGNTDTIAPNRGLPQGDTISCILWNIFYDALLCRLTNSTKGYQITNDISISNFAFADDLTPITNTMEDLQLQLDIIHSFLSIFKMAMNAIKTQIVINVQDVSSYHFNIGNTPITSLLNNSELIRILGAYFTLDGKHDKIYAHALNHLNNAIKCIYSKYSPGPITVYLVNNVLIPNISYKLQATPLTQTQYRSIDTKLRKLIKKKYALTQSTQDYILYDKKFGIGLFNFETILDQIQITNALTSIRSADITSVIARKTNEHFSQKLPHLLTECPIFTTTRNPPYWIHISKRLYLLDLQFRCLSFSSTDAILPHLSVHDYSKYYIQINKRFQNIQEISTTNHWTLPYSTIYESMTANFKKREDLLLTNTNSNVAPYFISILKSLNLKSTTDSYVSHISYPINIVTLPSIPLNTTNYIPLTNNLTIWTDGSYNFNNNPPSLGAAAVFSTDHIISATPTAIANPSSTYSELCAIYLALDHLSPTQTLTIITDSQLAITNIQNIFKNLNERQILKMNNHHTLQMIFYKIQTKSLSLKLEYVKAHDNSITTQNYNQEADNIAKEPNSTILVPSCPFDSHYSLTYLHINNQMIQQYPATYIKQQFQKSMHLRSINKINATHLNSTIDINNTLLLTTFNDNNYLNATKYREHKFRIKLLTASLTTKELLYSWNLVQDKKCPVCHTQIETQDHMFQCQNTTKLYPVLQSTTKSAFTALYQKSYPEQPDIYPALSTIIGINKIAFLSSNTAKGIISEELTTQIAKLLSSISFPKRKNSNQLKPLIIFLDCWLTAIYQLIWKPRCESLYESTNLNRQQTFTNLSQLLSSPIINNTPLHPLQSSPLTTYSPLSTNTSTGD